MIIRVKLTSSLPQNLRDMADSKNIHHHIIELRNPLTRENALIQLGNKRQVPNFAPIIWYTIGTVEALLEEIINAYRVIKPPTLDDKQCYRICNVLVILQSVASHPETRQKLVTSKMSHYLFPFLVTTSQTRLFLYVRLLSLGVIFALVKDVDEDIIRQLFETEIVPVLLHIIECDASLTKTLATFTLQRILESNVGLSFICNTFDRFKHIAIVLGELVRTLAEDPSVRLLKHVICCYLRLTDNARAREALRKCLPEQLKDPTFDVWIQEDTETKQSLCQLLQKLYPLGIDVEMSALTL